MKGKNGKNFTLIGSVYFFLVRGRLSSSFLYGTPSERGSVVKNGVDARFCKVYFGEYDHNSENEGKYRIMNTKDPLGKTSPCWIIPSPNIRCLKWFSVPNKVYLTKFPSSAYTKAPGSRNPVERSKSDFHPLHTRKVYCFMTHKSNCVRSYNIEYTSVLHI